MKIWKWQLNVEDRQQISMPKGAQILTVQIQHDVLCLWALVDDTAGPFQQESRWVAIIGTGNPIPTSLKLKQYIGTFQLYGGDLVFHVLNTDIKSQR